MAFPTIASADTKSGAQATNSTSWSLTYPTNIAAGDLIIGMIGMDGGSVSLTWPANWVKITPINGFGDGTAQIGNAYKIALGSETGAFTVTTPSEQGCWRVIRIPAASWHGTTAPEGGTGQSGSSANPDLTAFNPTNWDIEDTLWIAFLGTDGSVTCTGWPTGWKQDDLTTAGGHTQASGGSTGAGLHVTYLTSAAAAPDPSAFTLSGAEGYGANIIAVRPAAGGGAATSLVIPRRRLAWTGR